MQKELLIYNQSWKYEESWPSFQLTTRPANCPLCLDEIE